MSKDFSSQPVLPLPTSLRGTDCYGSLPTTWEWGQHFRKENAIPDTKEGEWLKPSLPQMPVFLVSSGVAWEDADFQAVLCKPSLR